MDAETFDVMMQYALHGGPHTLPVGADNPETLQAACDALADIAFTDCEAEGYNDAVHGQVDAAGYMTRLALSRPGHAEPVRVLLQTFLASLSL